MQSEEGGFGGEARHKLVQEFAVAYYNGSLKPNLAEKNPLTGRDVEFLMDAPEFEKIRRSDMWSFSTAVGTGYQYRVVYKDKRFSDLEPLMQMYSGAAATPDADSSDVERSLYEEILVLMRESRLPKTFKIQSPKEANEERMAAMLEEFGKSLNELGRRVRQLEEQLGAQKSQASQSSTQSENPS